MGRSLLVLLASLLFSVALPAAAPQYPPSDAPPSVPFLITADTKLQVVLTRPVWSRTAKAGDTLFGQTNFPLSINGVIAVPAGTYVEGRILSLTQPTRKSNHAEFSVVLAKLIFANGYIVTSPYAAAQNTANAHTTATHITVQVSPANDLLLDNGAQFELTVGTPLELNADQAAKAATQSRPPRPTEFRTATRCRPTPGSPGSPGSPDTVIPGSPGTPDTVIPGVNGAPPTVIPGIPATPPTIIPGFPTTSGMPGSVCPTSPVVIASVPETVPSTK